MVSLVAPIRLLAGSRGLSDYEIDADGLEQPLTASLEEAMLEDGRYWIRRSFPLPGETEFVRLLVNDSEAGGRRYTLRIKSEMRED